MEKQTFYNLLSKPDVTEAPTRCNELRELIEKYPYFQGARSMLLQLLYANNPVQFKQELPGHAMLIPDRRHLLYLLNKPVSSQSKVEPEVTAKQSKEPQPTVTTKTDEVAVPPRKRGRPRKNQPKVNAEDTTLILIENDTPPVKTIEADTQVDISGDSDILELIENGNGPDSNPSDLIEKFISEQPTIPRPASPPRGTSNEEVVDISAHSVLEPEELATETLAEIYALQGYIDKAISVYEKLRLKYPEKSSYFAGQIEKLKKQQ